MGNEVSVSVPVLHDQAVKSGHTKFRSTLRVWMVDESNVSLPSIPEATFNTVLSPSAKAVYIIRHEYKDNVDSSLCAKPENYRPLVPVLFDSPKLSDLLKRVDDACDSLSLTEPLEVDSGIGVGDSEVLCSTFFWVGKEASSVLQASALAAAMNMSRSHPGEVQGLVPLTWVVRSDITMEEKGDVPQLSEHFTFADREREKKAREDAESKRAEAVQLLQTNKLARELQSWVGMMYVPRMPGPITQQSTSQLTGSKEVVEQMKRELYDLFGKF